MHNLFVNPARAAHKFGYWRGPILVALAVADLAVATILLIKSTNGGSYLLAIILLLIFFLVMLILGIRNIYMDIFRKEYKRLAAHYVFWRKYH